MAPKFFIVVLFFSGFFLHAQEKVLTGKASFYANKFEGRTTASGAIFSQSKLTAAHKTLPFGTNVKVTNLANDKSVVVIVNDRGPFVPGRIIDLSLAAAKILDFIQFGVTDVIVEVLDDKNLEMPDELQELEDELLVSEEKIKKPEPPEENKAFYRLEAERISPEGFAVQVGSFEDSTNLLPLTEKIKTAYREEVTIQVKTIKKTNIYAVLVGSFDKRKKAEKFKNKVAEKFPGCFVVDYSETNKASN